MGRVVFEMASAKVFLFLLGFIDAVWPLTVRQSIPFAPFRMECPKGHGLVEVSIRLVTSAGGHRSDILYTCACEDLNLMFPIGNELKPLEREECRWTIPINPLSEADFESPCTGREYFAGVSRLALNPRTSFLCCQLRTREKSECAEYAYPQPSPRRPVVQLHRRSSVFTSLRVRKKKIVAMFCGMKTRPIADILADSAEEPTTAPPVETTERITTVAETPTAAVTTAATTTPEIVTTTEVRFHKPVPLFAPNPNPIFGIPQPPAAFPPNFLGAPPPPPRFVPQVHSSFPIRRTQQLTPFFQTPDGRLVPFNNRQPQQVNFGQNLPDGQAAQFFPDYAEAEATTQETETTEFTDFTDFTTEAENQLNPKLVDSLTSEDLLIDSALLSATEVKQQLKSKLVDSLTPKVLIIPAQNVPEELQAQAAPFAFPKTESLPESTTEVSATTETFEVTTSQSEDQTTTELTELERVPKLPQPDFSNFPPFSAPKITDADSATFLLGQGSLGAAEEGTRVLSVPGVPALKHPTNVSVGAFPDRAPTFQTDLKDSFTFLHGESRNSSGRREPLFIELHPIPAIDLEAATDIQFPDEANLEPDQTFIELERPSLPSTNSDQQPKAVVHRFGAAYPPSPFGINNYPQSGYNYHGHRPQSTKYGESPRFFATPPSILGDYEKADRGDGVDRLQTAVPSSGIRNLPAGLKPAVQRRQETTTEIPTTADFLLTTPTPTEQEAFGNEDYWFVDIPPAVLEEKASMTSPTETFYSPDVGDSVEKAYSPTMPLVVFDSRLKEKQSPRRVLQPERFFAFAEVPTAPELPASRVREPTTEPPTTERNKLKTEPWQPEEAATILPWPKQLPNIRWIAEPVGQRKGSHDVDRSYQSERSRPDREENYAPRRPDRYPSQTGSVSDRYPAPPEQHYRPNTPRPSNRPNRPHPQRENLYRRQRPDRYRRPPPGNILEFCTKQIASVDEDGLIIACGLGNDVWEPSHCPSGTVCFNARDSTYRICCPVFDG